MIRQFSKNKILTALVLSLAISSPLMAWDDCCPQECGHLYVGAFGGGIFATSSDVTQLGTAFFTEANGGPLAVHAQGRTEGSGTGFGGVQLGWESSPFCSPCGNWSFTPMFEVEAFFFGHSEKGHLINPTDRLPEHDFQDSFRLFSDTILVNGVFAFESCSFCGITPYVGGGIGAARLSLRNADSLQVDPLEVGINHFNSRTYDSSWAFAAQVKLGLSYKICSSLHIFGEYRYLFIDASNYILGSTVYPTHVPTSPWNVKIDSIQYNAFAFGVRYDL